MASLPSQIAGQILPDPHTLVYLASRENMAAVAEAFQTLMTGGPESLRETAKSLAAEAVSLVQRKAVQGRWEEYGDECRAHQVQTLQFAKDYAHVIANGIPGWQSLAESNGEDGLADLLDCIQRSCRGLRLAIEEPRAEKVVA